ncbi:MAG: hypothetical protein KDE20_19760, partial [Caldilineaceae bacterium]|nr:hypothetical protein [Caldilineaceae bacterium]
SGLGLKPDRSSNRFDLVRTALDGAPAYLVLDNFETLDAAAPTVAQLLAALPALTVITTTRRALRLKDEAIIELHGLDTRPTDDGPSEAAAFFVQRVRQERMDFAPTRADGRLVESICRRLGGHPLAIELAAAQLDFFGLAELRELTGQDVTPLAAPYQDVPPEHRSLAALLEGMWSQLSPAARAVLAQLSVFASSFTREAMQAVAPAGMDVYRELLRVSLLQTETESGWFSLHPLVQQYAAQRLLVKGLGDDARARHSRYFLAQFDLGGHFRALSIHKALHFNHLTRTQADAFLAWENAIAREDWALLDRAGLNFAGYLFWTQQPEAETRLLLLLITNLPAPTARSPRQHLLAGRCAAYLALNVNDMSSEESVSWLERSLAWLAAADEPQDLIAVVELYAEMILNHGIGPASKAEQLLARARCLMETHHFKTLESLTIASSGTLYVYQGRWTQAETNLAGTLAALSPSVNVAVYAAVMTQAMLLDDRETLARLIHAAQTLPVGKAEHQFVAPWIDHGQGVLLARQGKLQDACRQRAAAIHAAHRIEYMLALAHGELALWQTLTGDVASARVTADIALGKTHGNTSRLYVGFTQALVGVCHWLWGDTARAESLLRQALTLGLALEHTTMIFSPLYYLVRIHAARLPVELVARVAKIGAVSPAMYFALHPLAETYLTEQELDIADDDEQAALWATDLDAVTALLADVEEKIGKLN